MTNRDIKIDINNRFKDVFRQCESLGLIVSRKNAATILGLSPQLLSEVLNSRINVGTEVIYKFCVYFEVRVEYIFFGVLPVFIEQLEKEKLGLFDPDKSSKLLTVKFSKDYWIDDNFFAKSTSDNEAKEPPPPNFYIPNTFGVDLDAYAFMVGEPHMEPLIEQNMTVIAAKINLKTSVINGQVYVLDTKKYGIITRRLFWKDKEKSLLELVPENNQYESKEMFLKDIESIFRVITFLGYDLNKRSAVIRKHTFQQGLSSS